MARTGATQPQTSGRRLGEPAKAGSARTTGIRRALYVILTLNTAVAGAILYIHVQLAATQGAYTSFCNISSRVNCDAVLTSRYSNLLGFPLAGWALLTYGLLAAMVAWQGGASGPTRKQATLLLLGAAVWACIFSLYMGAIAVVVVGALCLLCSGMYVLGIVFALLAWRLARVELGSPLLTLRRMGLEAAAVAVSLAVIGGTQFSSVFGDGPGASEVPEDFSSWYRSLPVVDLLPPPDHVRGPDTAPLTIVEFSDFECAYCGKAFRDLQDLERQHPGSVRVIFHHFPLDSECNPRVQGRLHRNACLAAVAAECAAREGRFWEYHDLLFGAQDRLGREELIAQAASLGIDRDTFAACLTDPESLARVRDDAEAGGRLGVKSTPTLFVNGRAIEGALERPAYEYVIALEHHS